MKILLAIAALALASNSAAADRCKALMGDATATGSVAEQFASIPDAPTVITGAGVVSATALDPSYCRVQGFVAPQIQFELRLPVDSWNGRLLMQGCGGMCGWINMEAAADALARGYAVVNTDMGHQAPPNVAIWARNNLPAQIDFAYRSTWTVAVAAKHIVEAHYESAPRQTFFRGCSTGGRQGMLAAQRFPELFDGIIAGAPVLNQNATGTLHLLWSARANVSPGGEPVLDARDVARVGAAVQAACDSLDGVEDGVIPDPSRCSWRPEMLACGNGPDEKPCLSGDKIEALNKLYGGARSASGRVLYRGAGLALGSEHEWVPAFVGEGGSHGAIIAAPGLISEVIRHRTFFTPLPIDFDLLDFDFDRDTPRLALTEALYNAQNPDLRDFKEAGGKLLLYHGWDDIELVPGVTIDYYQTATSTLGGPENTLDFFRLFMVPGMAHCRRGPGADAIDYLSYLEDWVENGKAPNELLAHHLRKPQNYRGLPRVRFPLAREDYEWARPVYAYPDVAVYDGSGDWRKPANWKPSAR